MRKIRVIDSHTAGEPTRVVISGAPGLGKGSLADRRRKFQTDHADFRRAVINEPRGSDVLVGALVVEPVDSRCVAGAIFFNNVGVLNMCGHALIGVVVTLAHQGKIAAGQHAIETPVGTIDFEFDGENRVSFENVPSYRYKKGVTVEVPDFGPVTGDVAWGGNWFFLVGNHRQSLELKHAEPLTAFAWNVRQALEAAGITGDDGEVIDHIELFGSPRNPEAHSRNFVLCPGKAYDRSPCGTGTSAKLACLQADRKLAPGVVWKQEGIVGTLFEGSYRMDDNFCIPRITGSAYVTAETTLLLNPADPFEMGIRK